MERPRPEGCRGQSCLMPGTQGRHEEAALEFQKLLPALSHMQLSVGAQL